MTQLEGVLFQGVSLFIGLIGSFLFGRQSATAAAHEIVKPHAKSAFRRVLSLSESLGRLAVVIERIRSGDGGNTALSGHRYLDTLEAVVTEQIAVTADALEDWRDLIPEELAELERQLAERKRQEHEARHD